MKNKTLLLSLTVCCLSSFLFAQPLHRDGYLITSNLDSLTGTFTFHGVEEMRDIIWFESEGESEPKSYSPNQAEAFGYDDGFTRFEAIPIPKISPSKVILPGEQEQVFARLLESGELDLYHLKEKGHERFFMIADRKLYSFDPFLLLAEEAEVTDSYLVFRGSNGSILERIPIDNISEGGAVSTEFSTADFVMLNDTLYRVQEPGVTFLSAFLDPCSNPKFSTDAEINKSLLTSRIRKHNECVNPSFSQTFAGKAYWQLSLLGWWNTDKLSGSLIEFPLQVGGTIELRRNDWLPQLSLGYSLGVFNSDPIVEAGKTSATTSNIFRYQEESKLIYNQITLGYHALPGRSVRPLLYAGFGFYKRTTDLWTEELNPDPTDQILVKGRQAVIGIGLDAYFLKHVQLRVYGEWTGNYALGAAAGVFF